MAFENNQQDAFNLRNDTESLKQWQSELDKATTSIGAAEVAAEEELAALKLKNLAAQQEVRLKQLDRLIELEDKGIRELAKARLTLSDRQFELRKKEIQKEFQLAKNAAEELLKIKSKKAKSATEKPATSTTKDITAASKAKQPSTTITKKDSVKTVSVGSAKKVDDAKSTTPGVIDLISSIDGTLTSLHDTVVERVQASGSQLKEDASVVNSSEPINANPANTPPPTNIIVEPPVVEPPKKQEYSDNSKGLEKIDLGKYLFDNVRTMFEASRDAIKAQSSDIEKVLNSVTANNGKFTTQTSIDLAGDLLKSFESAEDAIKKVREFNEKQGLNRRITLLAEEQKLRAEHANTEYRTTQERLVAEAKAAELEHNKKLYATEERRALSLNYLKEQNKLVEAQIKAEAKLKYVNANKAKLQDQEAHKLRLAHTQAENAAREANITAAAMAADLALNKELYFQEEKWALEKAYVDTQNKLVEDRIKTEAALAYTGANRAALIAQEEQKLKNEHGSIALRAMQANIAAVAKANDLEHNRRLYAQEEYRALRNAFLEEQNKLTTEEIQAEAKLKFITNNEERILDQAAHKLRIGHINAEHDAMQALIDAQAKATDIENNRDQYLEEALQNLKVGHANKVNELNLAAIANEAKAKDLADNKEQYILEARLARENAFYDEQNRLAEDRIKAEEEIAWNASHRKELLDREEQKTRLNYLAEYQQLQLDSTNHLTENITKEQFIALKEQTRAAEDSIARREKASAASEKALAKLRSKGTLAEKKNLLKTQIKGRAAEKDWSKANNKFQITESMTTQQKADAQKAREVATIAEMAVNAATSALANLAQQLNDQTDKVGEKQAPIDTRLQGSNVNETKNGSYWKQLAKDMNKIGAVNPYFKQEDFASNIETLVNKGISFDIKQRAFLMTIQEKIANTFDVADGTLLRLVRIQQQDTTAGRLGMESALNSFLNSMYETSEYLTDVASSVRSSLGEMQALMEGAAATELEFQVQKWMGSLYSVGMSQDAVQSIAQAFGQIASGDISGLTGSGTGNLLIMAANEAGMSIADILQDGLNADETNKLMQAMVNYLAEIAESSSDSRVVQQQLASVYGVKASDLKAATNLASSIKDVSKQDLTYSGMLGQLNKMANSMALRTSTGEMLTNVWDNVQYTMATQMANNPILYLLPRMATLLEDYAGGIDLPFLNVMGFGVDLNTSVAQLMNVAAMSGSILGALGPMISGLGSAVSGSIMLNQAGIKTSGKAPVIARGSAQPLQHLGGSSISESGYVGNSSGSDVKNATMQDAADSKKKQLVEAKDEESSDDVVIKSQLAVVSIYNLLEEVAHGSQSLRVRLVGSGAGGSTAISCNCNHAGGKDPLNGNESAGATGPNVGTNGADNGNWVLSF